MAITCRFCGFSLDGELDEDVIRNLGVCTPCVKEERERLAEIEDDDREIDDYEDEYDDDREVAP